MSSRAEINNIAKGSYTITTQQAVYPNGLTANQQTYNVIRLPKDQYFSNIIYIKTKVFGMISKNGESKSASIQSFLSSLNVTSVRSPFAQFEQQGLIAYNAQGISRISEIIYDNEIDPYDVCMELMKEPDIEYAVPVFKRYITDYTPNDPRLKDEWHVTNLKMKTAWDITLGDTNVVIAVVDAGTDWSHEDLAANIWMNKAEKAGDTIDNDNNGYIDDIRGWDLVGDVKDAEANKGIYKPDNDPKPKTTTINHGTHVAGCIAAVGNNSKGVSGMAPKCKILPIKCGTDQVGTRSIYRGFEGIAYAALMKANIINCSWGGDGPNPVEQEIINAATAMGSLVVVSAGNNAQNVDNGSFYPAGYNNVMCVGSTDKSDLKSSFSNYGRLVSVYAPGGSILSTMPNNAYANMSGTSMSSPVAAGVAALVKSIHPDWEPQKIIAQLRSTVDNVVTTDLSLRPLYFGRINAYTALEINNPNVSTRKLPGIKISDLTFDSIAALSNFTPQKMKLTVRNYLSACKKVVLKLTPLQAYFNLQYQDTIIGDMGDDSKIDLNMLVTLLPTNPWSKGTADIMVTIKADYDDYENYQILQIPINIESKNLVTNKYTFPEDQSVLWYTCAVPDKDNFYLGGYDLSAGRGLLLRYNDAVKLDTLTRDPVYSMYVQDKNNLFLGLGTWTTSKTKILMSKDAGANWDSLDVSSITRSVYGFRIVDRKYALVVGPNLNNKWGIGLTLDSGRTWSIPSALPALLTGENVSSIKTNFFIDEACWIGTNKGRILKTVDFGKNWKTIVVPGNPPISQLYFSDPDHGMMIYTETISGSTNYLIASTIDGGLSWTKNRYNLTQNKQSAVYIYSPKETHMFIVVCSDGQVISSDDYGNTWKPILSKKVGSIALGTGFASNETVRLWNAENNIFYHEFPYMPDYPRRLLSNETGYNIGFNVVNVGDSSKKLINLANIGNVKVTIDSINIVQSDTGSVSDFRLQQSLPNVLSVGDTLRLELGFYPQSEGFKTATAKIYSNAEESEIKIKLSGTGKKVLAVEDNTDASEVEIYPNPVQDILTVKFGNCSMAGEFVRYEITDEKGTIISSACMNRGDTELSLNISGLAKGAYILKIFKTNNQHFISKKIVVE